MADLIKKIKIKKQDGTFTDYIPIGAEAQNVSTSDGDSVQLKLNKKPYYYNSIADMKADTKLKVGDMTITLGYYSVNDGGGATYKIKTTSTSYYEELNNGLVAELIINKELIPELFGAYGNGINDDTTSIQRCIDYANSNKIYNIKLSKKYLTSSPLTLYDGIVLYSDNSELTNNNDIATISNITSDLLYLTLTEQKTSTGFTYERITGLNIRGISFKGNKSNKLISNTFSANNLIRLNWGIIENCNFSNLSTLFNNCFFTGFEIRNIVCNVAEFGYIQLSDCNFNEWFIDGTGYNLIPRQSNSQITIVDSTLSNFQNIFMTGDTSDKNKGNKCAIELINNKDLSFENIVFDYFPGTALYLHEETEKQNNNIFFRNLVFRGCSTSSQATYKNAILAHGNNIKFENISFATQHLSGFDPQYNAFNCYDGYFSNLSMKDIVKSNVWNYDTGALSRLTIADFPQISYCKLTSKSVVLTVPSDWDSNNPVTIASGQTHSFTTSRINNLGLIYNYCAPKLPEGIDIINVYNGNNDLSIEVQNNSNESITLNTQIAFLITYIRSV